MSGVLSHDGLWDLTNRKKREQREEGMGQGGPRVTAVRSTEASELQTMAVKVTFKVPFLLKLSAHKAGLSAQHVDKWLHRAPGRSELAPSSSKEALPTTPLPCFPQSLPVGL